MTDFSRRRFWFFDLDGTLADTDGDIRLAWKAAIADLGLECPSFDEKFVAGPPLEESAKMLFPGIYTDALGAAIRERFGFHYDNDGFPSTVEYPGVLAAVGKIASSGARVFIATNKRLEGASAMARKFGWDRLFEKIYTADMHKDDPAIGKMSKTELLAFAMRETGADATGCVMAGDTANDFKAAKANSMASIAVRWGYGKPEEIALADAAVSDAAELEALATGAIPRGGAAR